MLDDKKKKGRTVSDAVKEVDMGLSKKPNKKRFDEMEKQRLAEDARVKKANMLISPKPEIRRDIPLGPTPEYKPYSGARYEIENKINQ